MSKEQTHIERKRTHTKSTRVVQSMVTSNSKWHARKNRERNDKKHEEISMEQPERINGNG